jgi:anti-anti-sigma factor
VEITVSQEQGRRPVTVFHIQGDVNVTTYEDLQQKAREAFDAGMRDLVLDLAEVPYVSSAGIRAITSIFRMLRSNAPEETPAAIQKGLSDGTFRSPHLKLAAPQNNVKEVLKISGVDMFLEVYPTVQDAVGSY